MEINYSISSKEIRKISRCITKAVWSDRENTKIKYTLQVLNILLWIPAGIFIAWSFSKSDEYDVSALSGLGLGI